MIAHTERPQPRFLLASGRFTGIPNRGLGQAAAVVAAAGLAVAAQAGDVTATLERLGNPQRYIDSSFNPLVAAYGRNVWDLQRFAGKIYLGGGSTLINVGPVRIQAYNPASGTFEVEQLIEEEGIDLYRVFGDELYTPAADPRDTERNKYYRKTAVGWEKIVSDERLATAHIRDLYRYPDGLIVAAGNSVGIEPDENFSPGAVYSDDDGASFAAAVAAADLEDRSGVFFALFAFQDTLFATTTYFNPNPELDDLGVYVFDRSRNTLVRDKRYTNSSFLTPEDGFDRRMILQPWLPVVYRGALVYPVKARLIYAAGGGNVEVEQFRQGFAFYIKTSLADDPQAVVFPDPQAIGEDAVIAGDRLFVLANRREADGSYRVYLYCSDNPTDPGAWDEVLYFDSSNVAKSLEVDSADGVNGHAYFGLGREASEPVDPANDHAGELLRVALSVPRPERIFEQQFEPRAAAANRP